MSEEEKKRCPYCGSEDVKFFGVFVVSVNQDSGVAKTYGCDYCARLFYEEAE